MLKIANIVTNFLMTIFDRSWKYSNKSYSQEGEDLVLSKYLEAKKEGFYVDVGAHHPFRFSNTYLFYKRGWSGINIDATPGSMVLFKKYRPRDINIEFAVSDKRGPLQYFIFDEPALNGFSARLSANRAKNTKYKIEKIVKLKSKKLSYLLDKFIPRDTFIDFMNIDVEGYNMRFLCQIIGMNIGLPIYLLRS